MSLRDEKHVVYNESGVGVIEPMDEPELLIDVTGRMTRVTLNRPHKRNALSRELLQQLLQTLKRTASDPKKRLLILGAADGLFCAGMDLAQMQATAESDQREQLWQQDAQLYRDVLVELFKLPMPTLAVVQGPALAGGVGLVLACDIVLAADEAFFSLPEPKRGITATIVTPLLTYRIGAGASSYLLLSGQSIDSQQALRVGLCHEVVPSAQLCERSQKLTASILTGSPRALADTKSHLLATAGQAVIAQLDEAIAGSAAARNTPDAREGLAAFLEKRNPAWDL